MAGQLAVIDRASGELLDLDKIGTQLAEAEAERVAAFVIAMQGVRELIADAEQVALGELLHRLDKRGEWTLRLGNPEGTVQYEVTAPSPTAGTTGVSIPVLREGLLALLAEDVIDRELAESALVRTVTFKASVPTDCDLEKLRERLLGISTMAGIPLANVEVVTSETATLGGIAKLKKIGRQAAELYEACLTTVPAPPRRAKVKAKTKRSAAK